jgi:hypothetical protein
MVEAEEKRLANLVLTPAVSELAVASASASEPVVPEPATHGMSTVPMPELVAEPVSAEPEPVSAEPEPAAAEPEPATAEPEPAPAAPAAPVAEHITNGARIIEKDTKAITDVNGNVVMYDHFIRKNTLYLVSTFHSSSDPALDIMLGDVRLSEVSFNEAEPVRYFMCPLSDDSSSSERRSFNVTIDGVAYYITPEVVPERDTKYKLAVTTLFKNESAAMVKRFVSYYRGQGAEVFYLYYNGDAVPDSMPRLPGVVYLTWGYPYQIDTTEWIGVAQVTALTSFRLRYWDDCDWVAIVDMDEYVYNINESVRLVDYLSKKTESANAVCVQNYWASVPKLGGKISYSAQGMGWLERTKWIYNTAFRGHFSVYRPKGDGEPNKLFCEDLRLLHIINHFHPERRELMTEPMSKTENITLTRL